MRLPGFQFKISFLFILVLVMVLTTMGYSVFSKAVNEEKAQLRTQILEFAKLGSMLVDGNKHSLIKPEKASQDTQPYKEIQKSLVSIREISSIIDSVYTMIKTDKENIWMFVVDSGDKKGIVACCGDTYNVSKLFEMRQAFNGPIVDKEPTTDKWGTYLSGYAPVKNDKGETVAIIGLDVSVKTIEKLHQALTKRFVLSLLLGILISLIIGWLVSRSMIEPISQLILCAREIEKGNYNQKVRVKASDEIKELVDAFNKMIAGVKDSQKKVRRLYFNAIKALVHTIEAKDPYTRGHSERVTKFTVEIARRLGYSEEQISVLEDVSLLHDIGKIGIPEAVLSKTDPLTPEDWQKIKLHPIISEEILRPIEALKPGLTIVLQHHERPDGKGYPLGLKGEQINAFALIIGVADAYDAMTSDRPYRKAMSKEKAISILKENMGTQFDPKTVDVFLTYLNEKSPAHP